MGHDWLQGQAEWAIGAHLRGDDRLALVCAERLTRALAAAEAEAQRRGLARPSGGNTPGKCFRLCPWLPQLLADQRRRSRQRRQGTAPPVMAIDYPDGNDFEMALCHQMHHCKDKAQRMAVLIAELEEIADITLNSLEHNAVVDWLVDQGEDAVGPLLKCLEGEPRLTRVPPEGHCYPCDDYGDEAFPGVDQPARAALERILQAGFREPREILWPGEKYSKQRRAARKVLAEEVRAYWEQCKGSPQERWYRTLANNRASKQWLDAAKRIVEPDRRGPSDWFIRDAGAKMPGECLRDQREPSVSRLMAKRAARLGRPRPEEMANGLWDATKRGCDMALHLAKWDPPASRPTLREQMEQCRRFLEAPLRDGDQPRDLAEYLARLTLARAAAKDLRALDEYADGLGKGRPGWISSLIRGQDEWGRRTAVDVVLDPLWRYRTHPAIAKAAERLFADEHSPWTRLLEPDERAAQDRRWRHLRGPLLASEGFRKQVLRMLENKEGGGVYHAPEDDKAGDKSKKYSATAQLPADPLRPPPGTEIVYRVCDQYAFELSPLDGTPKIELYWPEKDRDRAVAACAAFLRQYGHRFRLDEELFDGNGYPLSGNIDVSASLTFPLRTRPATPEDVRRGEAIFSLAGQGQVRACNVPRLPVGARWTTLKDYPVLKEVPDVERPDGVSWKQEIDYEQWGVVWQVEEVRRGARWQRYYGFVGRYGLARVPAEEIELWTSLHWLMETGKGTSVVPLGDDFDAALIPPDNVEQRGGVPRYAGSNKVAVLRKGRPMVFKVRIDNHSGLDRPVPTVLETVGSGQPPPGKFALKMYLDYRPESMPVVDLEGLPPMTTLSPITLPSPLGTGGKISCKASARLTVHRPKAVMQPGELFDLLQFDLQDLFPVNRTGSYMVVANFVGGPPDKQARQSVFSFLVAEEK
jgi:hypothetical protein